MGVKTHLGTVVASLALAISAHAQNAGDPRTGPMQGPSPAEEIREGARVGDVQELPETPDRATESVVYEVMVPWRGRVRIIVNKPTAQGVYEPRKMFEGGINHDESLARTYERMNNAHVKEKWSDLDSWNAYLAAGFPEAAAARKFVESHIPLPQEAYESLEKILKDFCITESGEEVVHIAKYAPPDKQQTLKKGLEEYVARRSRDGMIVDAVPVLRELRQRFGSADVPAWLPDVACQYAEKVEKLKQPAKELLWELELLQVPRLGTEELFRRYATAANKDDIERILIYGVAAGAHRNDDVQNALDGTATNERLRARLLQDITGLADVQYRIAELWNEKGHALAAHAMYEKLFNHPEYGARAQQRDFVIGVQQLQRTIKRIQAPF